MGKPLQQSKFNQVMRTIKDLKKVGSYSARTVADEHGISVTTVNFIRNAKTWSKYQDFLTNGRKKRVSRPEKQLEKSLEQLELNPVEYVTKKQFTDAIDSLNGKVAQDRSRADIHQSRIDAQGKRLDRFHIIINRVQQLKPRWFRQD